MIPIGNRRSSRGYLMLDLIIVLSLIVVVLSVTSIWVYKTMRYSSEVRQRDTHARNISRLSHQVRTDSNDAKSIVIDGATLKFGTADGDSIEYTIKANRIHRTASTSGDSQKHQDYFEFAANAVPQLRTMAGGLISLDIERNLSALTPSKSAEAKKLDVQIQIPRIEVSK